MKDLRRKNAQVGFSLLELMIVMVLMLVIMAMVFTLLRGTITTANTNYEMTEAGQGLRNSQEFITRDLLSAGDGLKGIANVWLPTGFVSRFLSTQSATSLDPTNNGFISLGAVFADDNIVAGIPIIGANPSKNIRPRTDRLTVMAADPSFTPRSIPAGGTNHLLGTILIPGGNLSDFKPGEIYFISDGLSGTFGAVTRKNAGLISWESGDALGLNRTGLTSALASVTNLSANPVTLTRIQIIQYFVDEDGKLIRRVFGVKDTGYSDSIIAEHVTSLQFRYILKPSTNGTQIFDQPKLRLDEDEQSLVRMIEVDVRVETAYPLQDGEKHEVQGVTEVGIRNIQFLEALTPRDSEGNTQPPNSAPTPRATASPAATRTP